MTQEIAQQIASLINERNQLSKLYTAKMILEHKENYVYFEKDGELIACAESKKVQWYQWEICHVSVAKKFERKGKGTEILLLAENKAKKGNARILQSTIRSNNENSIGLFLKNNYKQVNEFSNQTTGNIVNVYQKAV